MRYSRRNRKVAEIKNSYPDSIVYPKRFTPSDRLKFTARKLPLGYWHPFKLSELKSSVRALELRNPLYLINISEIHLSNDCRSTADGSYSRGKIMFFPLEKKQIYEYTIKKSETTYHWQRDAHFFADRVVQLDGDTYKVFLTVKSWKRYYLDHILLHEIGHSFVLNGTNSMGESEAEAFAVSYLKDPKQHDRMMKAVELNTCREEANRRKVYQWLEDHAERHQTSNKTDLVASYGNKFSELKRRYNEAK